MLHDIRIAVGFTGHKKTRLLKIHLGERAIEALLSLWEMTSLNCPSGNWGKITSSELAQCISWSGDPDELLRALIDCGFVDIDDNGNLLIHNWERRNPHIVAAAKRRSGAKKAVIRWQE